MKKTFFQIAVLLLLIAAVPFAYVIAAPNTHMGQLLRSNGLYQGLEGGNGSGEDTLEDLASPTDAAPTGDPAADVTGGATPEPTFDPNAPDVTGGATSEATFDPNAPDVTGGATSGGAQGEDVDDDEDEDETYEEHDEDGPEDEEHEIEDDD